MNPVLELSKEKDAERFYTPVWKGVVEGYVKNTISKNLWKFLVIGYEFEDLYQEAFLVFLSCKNKHENVCPTLIENQKRFMEYFKQALHNFFYDLSQEVELRKIYVIDTEISELDFCLQSPEKKSLGLILEGASLEVKQILTILLNAPRELLESLGFHKKYSKGVCGNTKLCALIGADPTELNLVSLVKRHLSGR